MDFQLLFTLIVLAILIGLGVVLFAYWALKHPDRTMTGAEYKTFFYMGVGYLIVGALLSFVYPGEFRDFFYLMILGIIFTSVGLSNLDKWKKK